MRKYLLLLFLLFIPCRAHGQTNIQSGPTNPTFCKPGAFFYNTTSATYQQCGPVNTWAAAGGSGTVFSGGTVIDVSQAPYNVKVGFTVGDATFAVGANTISCPNSDCNFNATTMNGWICFGTNLGLDTDIITIPSTVVLPQGLLTVTGAQTATCSGGNGTASAGANQVLVVGPDADAGGLGLTAAWNAAILSCSSVQLPAGIILVQTAEFNANSAQDKCIIDRTAGYGVLGVQGWGSANTTIVPTPNFSAASCTGTTAADGCFFGSTAIQVQALAIWGAGQGAIGAGFNGKTAVHLSGTDAITTGSNSYIYNVLLATWGATTAGFTGFRIDGESDALAVGVHNDGMGSTGCIFRVNGSGKIDLYNQFCAVNNVNSMVGQGATSGLTLGRINSYGGVYGFGNGTSKAAIDMEANANGCGGACLEFGSFGDAAPYPSGTSGFELLCNAICRVDGAMFNNSTSGGATVFTNASGSVVYLSNSSVIESAGSGQALQNGTSGAKIISLGGNVISGPSAVFNTAGASFLSNPSDIYTGTFTAVQGLTGTGSCATITTTAGTGTVGTLTCTGTTGASTVVIAPNFVAAHNWVCAASDLTTAANVLRQSATSTTTCTIAGTVNANDVLTFTATPY